MLECRLPNRKPTVLILPVQFVLFCRTAEIYWYIVTYFNLKDEWTRQVQFRINEIFNFFKKMAFSKNDLSSCNHNTYKLLTIDIGELPF